MKHSRSPFKRKALTQRATSENVGKQPLRMRAFRPRSGFKNSSLDIGAKQMAIANIGGKKLAIVEVEGETEYERPNATMGSSLKHLDLGRIFLGGGRSRTSLEAGSTNFLSFFLFRTGISLV